VNHWLRCIGIGAALGVVLAAVVFRVSEHLDTQLVSI
jgi:hypothetical protein